MSAQRVIYGFHSVQSRLRQGAAGVDALYVDASRDDRRTQTLVETAKGMGLMVHPVDAKRLEGLTGNARHQGVVAIVAPPAARELDDILDALAEPPLLLILDGVTDPHNLGACLRVADAMGVHAVIAPKDRAVGITPVVSKVASGAAESVPYFAVTNLARTLRELKDRDIWILGADERAETDLYGAKLTGPLGLVMGAEGEGMRRLTREHCDELVRIPMAGTVESLNVSVASGICLAEARRQRRAS